MRPARAGAAPARARWRSRARRGPGARPAWRAPRARRARAAHRTPPRARARRPTAAGLTMGISYGRAPGGRAGGGGHCPAPRYTAVRAGVVRRCPRAGAAPEAATRGSADMSVDDATRARTAMRLYGRQSRARARRRRVLLSLGIVLGAARDPARAPRHAARRRRARRARGRRPARRRVASAGRARDHGRRGRRAAARRDRDGGRPLGDASRPTTWACASTPRARRRAALDTGRVRGGLLFSLGYSRSIAPVLRYPKHLALPVELANVTQAPVDARLVLKPSGAAIAVPAKARCRLRSRRGAARDHARRTRGPQRRCRCAPCRRPPRSRLRPRTAPRPASRGCCPSRSRSRDAARRPAAGPCGGSRRCSPRRLTGT